FTTGSAGDAGEVSIDLRRKGMKRFNSPRSPQDRIVHEEGDPLLRFRALRVRAAAQFGPAIGPEDESGRAERGNEFPAVAFVETVDQSFHADSLRAGVGQRRGMWRHWIPYESDGRTPLLGGFPS